MCAITRSRDGEVSFLQIRAWTSSHLGRLLAGFAIQAAYPPALQQLVVRWVSLHLLPLECGTIAGFQTGLLPRGFILGWSFDGLHWLHILISLELSPKNSVNEILIFFLLLNS